MKIIRGLHNFVCAAKPRVGSVVTIGNYDGIHLGHQKILQIVREEAVKQNLKAILITFEPLSRTYFTKNPQHKKLINLREKLLLLEKSKIDEVLLLRFNQKLANVSAADFIEEVLLTKLKMKCLVVGENFAFGHNREGNCTLLKEYAAKYGFRVIIVQPVIIDNHCVSSTLIRHALIHGNLALAQKFLGRTYSISGRIIHGDKRGRNLNVPTANIHIHHKIIPLSGVYAIRAYGIKPAPLNGIANIGFRPTIGDNKRLLEVYLLDFNEEIYGKLVRIEFLFKIREEKKFANFTELKNQIEKDILAAKQGFKAGF